MLVFSGSRSNVNLKAFPRSSSYLRSLTKCCGERTHMHQLYQSPAQGGNILATQELFQHALSSGSFTCLDFCTQFGQLLLRHGCRLVRQPPELFRSLLPGVQNQHWNTNNNVRLLGDCGIVAGGGAPDINGSTCGSLWRS